MLAASPGFLYDNSVTTGVSPGQRPSDPVAQQRRGQIKVKRWVAGATLPTGAVLAGQFGVSRTEVREAV